MNDLTIKRFWAKVDKQQEGCWAWKASKRNKGYGAFIWADAGGEIIQGSAHRFSYELHYGSIPAGICVLHKCDNPACVRPEHLFLGTKKDNNLDMVRKERHVSGGTHCGNKGKWKKGVGHWNYRIDSEIILSIKKDRQTGLSYNKLSRKYGINISYAWRVIHGKARRDG